MYRIPDYFWIRFWELGALQPNRYLQHYLKIRPKYAEKCLWGLDGADFLFYPYPNPNLTELTHSSLFRLKTVLTQNSA